MPGKRKANSQDVEAEGKTKPKKKALPQADLETSSSGEKSSDLHGRADASVRSERQPTEAKEVDRARGRDVDDTHDVDHDKSKPDSKDVLREGGSSSSKRSSSSRAEPHPSRNRMGNSARKFKLTRKDATNLQFKQLKPKFVLYLVGFSEDGLRLGKEKEDGRAGSLYMRFTNVTAVNRKEDSVKQFLEEVDTLSSSLWDMYQEIIRKEFAVPTKTTLRLDYRNGWQEKVLESYNEIKEGKIEKVFYPHPKFTKLAKIKNGRMIPIKASLHSQVDRLANSDWSIQIGISAFAVEYQEKAERVVIYPYFSMDKISYIDEGQSTILDQDRQQELQEEREKAEFDSLLAFASDLLTKDK